MGLKQIFEEIGDALEIDVTFDFDPNALEKYDKLPRIAAEPLQETFQGPGGAGVAGKARALWTRRSTVVVHLWEKDEPSVENLLRHFVAAVHRTCQANYQLKSGKWALGGATTSGLVYILEVEFLIPVTRLDETYKQVTSMPLSYGFDPILEE